MDENVTDREKPVCRGEIALPLAIVINSFGVVLMLYSGSGISAISSVPFAFSEVLPALSLGTWTYLFQGLLILSLMLLRKRFVFQYLYQFRNRALKPLLSSHCANRSFSEGTGTDHRHSISENQNII